MDRTEEKVFMRWKTGNTPRKIDSDIRNTGCRYAKTFKVGKNSLKSIQRMKEQKKKKSKINFFLSINSLLDLQFY